MTKPFSIRYLQRMQHNVVFKRERMRITSASFGTNNNNICAATNNKLTGYENINNSSCISLLLTSTRFSPSVPACPLSFRYNGNHDHHKKSKDSHFNNANSNHVRYFSTFGDGSSLWNSNGASNVADSSNCFHTKEDTTENSKYYTITQRKTIQSRLRTPQTINICLRWNSSSSGSSSNKKKKIDPTTAGTPTTDNDTTPNKSSNEDDNDNDGKEISTASIIEHWKEQVTSIPNIITISRVVCTPVLAYLIIHNKYELAIIGCIVASLSDVADGYIAKHYNMSTILGTYLDPLADKFFVNVLAVSLWYIEILPTPLISLWIMKDTILILGTLYSLLSTAQREYGSSGSSSSKDTKKKRFKNAWKLAFDPSPKTAKLKVEPTFTSKVNTALQFITLGTAIVLPVSTTYLHYDLSLSFEALCWVTGGTTIASVLSYAGHPGIQRLGSQMTTTTTKTTSHKK